VSLYAVPVAEAICAKALQLVPKHRSIKYPLTLEEIEAVHERST